MRLLLVEDDRKIASFILKGLHQSGFAVDPAETGEDGLHLALTQPYDAMIIDLMLPGMDGLRLIAELRRRLIQTPVLILSAKRSVALQAREFALLEYLMRQAGHVVSKTMLLEHVWDYRFDPQTNVVDVLVCRVRAKVDRAFAVKLIHT